MSTKNQTPLDMISTQDDILSKMSYQEKIKMYNSTYMNGFR